MKIKRCFLIFMCAMLLVSAVACTGDGDTSSSKDAVNSTAESPSVESGEDSSTEESSVPVPVGFDDGIAFGYHILGNSMCGDVLFLRYVEDSSAYADFNSQRSLFQSYLGENSFTCKVMAAEEFNVDAFKTPETEVPAVSFESVYNAPYGIRVSAVSNDIVKYTYEEARTAELPIYLSLQTAPLTENTVSDIQAEYGVDEKQAVSIYRQQVIDTLKQCGLHVDGFGDIYSLDTYKAMYITKQLGGQDEQVDAKDYSYEDSVYETSTHLVFSAYGTAEEIEALEAFLKSESNKLMRMRAMPSSGYWMDSGKPAYVIENAETASFNYVHQGQTYFGFMAEVPELYGPM